MRGAPGESQVYRRASSVPRADAENSKTEHRGRRLPKRLVRPTTPTRVYGLHCAPTYTAQAQRANGPTGSCHSLAFAGIPGPRPPAATGQPASGSPDAPSLLPVAATNRCPCGYLGDTRPPGASARGRLHRTTLLRHGGGCPIENGEFSRCGAARFRGLGGPDIPVRPRPHRGRNARASGSHGTAFLTTKFSGPGWASLGRTPHRRPGWCSARREFVRRWAGSPGPPVFRDSTNLSGGWRGRTGSRRPPP